ncbi:MAG: hypothetical protein O0X93_07860 [Methanocorpusculum sp.]|nr:hypothetical protein [Methanocorpusculum sp.]MDE2523054.1 hypothetical protein [Methanocorpusculum sp.]MDE2524626.1 hypothetical protein [Methanocorpusculum sp.]
MRRVSYQFPNRCDLEFETDVPFAVFLNAVESLAGRQDNFRTSAGPIKREISVFLAHDRLGFEKIEPGANISKTTTDAADILITLTDTLLKASGNVPLNDHRFMIRSMEKGARTEIFITKSPSIEGFDAMDMKKMILGALA